MFVGDPLQFELTLWNFAEDMFVQARIYADGAELPFSPLNIPHKELGTYYLRNDELYKFPEYTDEVLIVYRVFNDSAFTVLSCTHAPSDFKYLVTKRTETEIEEKLDKIIDLVTSQGLTSQVIGYVDDGDQPLVGYVLIDDIIGYVDTEIDLIGFTTDEQVTGDTDNDEDLDGMFTL